MIVAPSRPRTVLDAHPIEPCDLAARLSGPGAAVLDTRHPDRLDAGHLPGSLNLPLSGRALVEHARLFVSAEAELVVVGESDEDAEAAARPLQRGGVGARLSLLKGGVVGCQETGYAVHTGLSIDPVRATRELGRGGVGLIDVRRSAEWQRDHIPGSVNLPIEEVAHRPRLPRLPLLVAGSSSTDAAVAASVFRATGNEDVWRVAGASIRDMIAAPSPAAAITT